MNKITIAESKNILNYIIDNNRKLSSEGKKVSAVCLCGPAGIGKTDIVIEVAKERNMTFVKLNMAELEEIGDLIGFPLKQYKINILQEDGTKKPTWISHDLLQTYFQMPCESYELTEETRMSYAPPQWMPQENNENGCILFLDDFSRALPMFIQATMELIDRGTFVSWKLPENTTIVLSQNPESEGYNTSSQDLAQMSRYINFNVEFNLSDWAKWAERAGIDNRAINFALQYGDELFKEVNGDQVINARSYVTFANAISGLKNWEDSKSLAMILNISKGCFPNDKDNIVGHLFTSFIANKLDKLISPEDLLLKPWNVVKAEIERCVYNGDEYRANIASILGTRLLNYACVYFDRPKSKSALVQDRLIEIIDANEEKMLFTEDIIFNIVRELTSKYSAQTNRLVLNKKIRDKIL